MLSPRNQLEMRGGEVLICFAHQEKSYFMQFVIHTHGLEGFLRVLDKKIASLLSGHSSNEKTIPNPKLQNKLHTSNHRDTIDAYLHSLRYWCAVSIHRFFKNHLVHPLDHILNLGFGLIITIRTIRCSMLCSTHRLRHTI